MRKTEKQLWGPGPWEKEDDRYEWTTAAGYPGLMTRGPLGNWCGYAAVPNGHPLWGAAYDAWCNIEVHGGLTYSGPCRGHICHTAKPGDPDNVWWFGFDCAHAFDFMPAMGPLRADRSFGPTVPTKFPDEVYRDYGYVREQVESLASQLQELERGSRKRSAEVEGDSGEVRSSRGGT